MLVYIVIFNVIFLSSILDIFKVNSFIKRNVLIFNVILLSVFYGFSWECSGDWSQYYWAFRNAKWTNIFHLDRGYVDSDEIFEPGFAFFNVLCKTVWNSYNSFLLFGSFIRYALPAYFGWKMCKKPMIFFAAYFSMDTSFPTRQHFVTPLIVISIFYLLNDKRIKSFFYLVLSSFIHKVAIFSLPVIILAKKIKMLNLGVTSVIIITAIVTGVFAQNYIKSFIFMLNLGGGNTLSDAIIHYSDFQSDFFGEDRGKSLAQIVLIVLFIGMFYWKGLQSNMQNKNYPFFYNLYIAYIFIQIFTSYGAGDVGRISNSFIVSFAWLMAVFFEGNFKWKYIFFLFFISILEYRLYNYVTAEVSYLYIPYKSLIL